MSDEPPSTLPPGTVVGERYRIDALLGEGGMGKVYQAEHIHIQKKVAIKVLHAEMSSMPEYVARFEREAVAAAKVSHPNVAAALDFGRLANGSFYIVLEYVAGTDLRTMLANGPLPKERAIRIARQIAAAVGAAHAAGIIHRDLKPENVMVVDHEGDPDSVKVLDFGIAKIDAFGTPGQPASPTAGTGQQPLTKIGAVFGTPDYMSPEQALGQPVDGRSDLYSIGVIFHELLTGERMFKGGAVTLMRAHVLEEAPALPPQVSAAVGPRVEAIVRKLLQKAPADRYASAAELLRAIDELDDRGAEEAPLATEPPADPLLRTQEVDGLSARRPSRQVSRRDESTSIPELPLGSGSPSRRGRLGRVVLGFLVVGGIAMYFFGQQEAQSVLGSLLGQAPPASGAASTPQATSSSAQPETSASVENGDPIGPVAQAAASGSAPAPAPTTDDSAEQDASSVSPPPSSSAATPTPRPSATASSRPTSPHPPTHPASTPSHKGSKPATPSKHSVAPSTT